ncbi:MAG: AbrB/MazE/SpoVT family DNA-binding domain-containing protein [Fimbriimonadaceae bacterium]
MQGFAMGCTKNMEACFYGSVTVGERGQVVIPAEARNEMGIRPGDKLLIMKHPVYQGLMVAKIEALRGFLDEFAQEVERMDSEEPQSEAVE